MTVRDIQAHLAEMYDVTVSPELISKVTNAVLEEAKAWQNRPLEPVYAAIYLDAIVCRVRDHSVVARKAAYLAVGIDSAGYKDVLGIWIDQAEGAKFGSRSATSSPTAAWRTSSSCASTGSRVCPRRSKACDPTRSCRPA